MVENAGKLMKSMPEMFQRPCLILACCITIAYLVVFYIISLLSLPWRNDRFGFFLLIVFLPQLTFSEIALSSDLPHLFRVGLAFILAFIPSLVHARILLGIRKIFGKKENKAVREGIVILLLLAFITTGFLLQVLVTARESSRRAACMNNVRSLVQMSHMYTIEYEGEFPASFKALDAAGYTIGNLTSCPTVGGRADYGFNSAATMDCPPGTPLVGDFDSTNHAGRIFRRRDRHAGNIGYVDGSTRMYIGEYSPGSGPLENVAPEDWVRQ